MPQVLTAAKLIVGIGTAATTAGQVAVLVGRMILLTAAQKALAPKPKIKNFSQQKLITIRATAEPQRLIYGEDLVSGPLMFSNLSGPKNIRFYSALPIAGHECDDIRDIWFDADVIDDADIDDALTNPTTPTFEVTAGKFRGSESFETPTLIERRLGDVDGPSVLLNTAFPFSWTANHKCFQKAHLVVLLAIITGQENVYSNGPPQAFRALARGKVVYDPRLDDTNGGTGPQRLADDTTWTWTDNPALCAADYIKGGFGTITGRNPPELGMEEDFNRISWPHVITAADRCDGLVTIPDGLGGSTTQKRYTFGITLSSADAHGTNLSKIVDSMLGWVTFSQGLWIMYAGGPQTATETLDGSYLRGKISLQAQAPHADRYNLVRGNYFDPGRDYQNSAYIEASSSTFANDDGAVLPKNLDFPGYQNEFRAQRGAVATLRRSRRQKIIVWEGNWKCFPIQTGTVVNVTEPDLLLSSAPFLCTGWEFFSNGGVNLTLVEWDNADFDDLALGEYQERVDGVIEFEDFGVPPPTGLAGVLGVLAGHNLSWTNPPTNTFKTIEIWASDDNDRNNAVKIDETIASEYIRPTINKTQYYWIRAQNQYGDFSDFEPQLVTGGVQVLIDIPAPQNLNITSDVEGVLITLTPPAAAKYSFIEVWSSGDNDRNNAIQVGEFRGNFFVIQQEGVFTRWYWVRARGLDDVGFSAWNPASSTGGVKATGGQPVLPLMAEPGFDEQFDGYNSREDFEHFWEIVSGNPTITFPEEGLNGGKVLQVVGAMYARLRRNIPYKSDTPLYRVEARIRRTVADAGNEKCSLGFLGVRANGTTLIDGAGGSGAGNTMKCILSEFDMGKLSLNVFSRVFHWISGTRNSTVGVNAATNSLNDDSAAPWRPNQIRTATGGQKPTYMRPTIECNQVGPSTGVFQMDYFAIHKRDDSDPAQADSAIDPNFSTADDTQFWAVETALPGAIIDVGGGVENGNALRFPNMSNNTIWVFARHPIRLQGDTMTIRFSYKITDNASGLNASSKIEFGLFGKKAGTPIKQRYIDTTGTAKSTGITSGSLIIDSAWHQFTLTMTGLYADVDVSEADFVQLVIVSTSADAADDYDLRIGRVRIVQS